MDQQQPSLHLVVLEQVPLELDLVLEGVHSHLETTHHLLVAVCLEITQINQHSVLEVQVPLALEILLLLVLVVSVQLLHLGDYLEEEPQHRAVYLASRLVVGLEQQILLVELPYLEVLLKVI